MVSALPASSLYGSRHDISRAATRQRERRPKARRWNPQRLSLREVLGALLLCLWVSLQLLDTLQRVYLSYAGHPFDLTKTRLQTAPPGTYTGATDVVRKLLARDGVTGHACFHFTSIP